MQLKDFLKDDLLLIVPSNQKEKIYYDLNQEKKLWNISIMTFSEIEKKVLFQVKEEAYLYLKEKYHYNYEVIEKFLRNLYFVEEKEYPSNKLKLLVQLKKELSEQGFITIDELFPLYLKQKEVLIYGFDFLNDIQIKIKTILEQYTKVEMISPNKKSLSTHFVYAFDTIEEEVEFVLNQISSLLKEQKQLNQIYLTNVSKEYIYPLKKYSKWYHLPIHLEDSYSVYETNIGKYFLENFNGKEEETLLLLQQRFDLKQEENQEIYNKLIDVLNTTNIREVSYLKRLLQQTFIQSASYQNAIQVASLENSYFKEEDIVFLLSFNQGILPKIYKDEDYITDNLKSFLSLKTTSEKNKQSKEATIKAISRIKNLTITYKNNSLSESYYPSNLIQELGLEVIYHYHKDLQTSYSKENDTLKLGMMLDNLLKYGYLHPDLPLYYHSINSDYQTYDNRYHLISKETLQNYCNQKLVLSYSNVNTFYKCQFRYYLDNILKINLVNDTFYTMIGNLYHYVLSKIYSEDFNFDKEVNYFLSKQTLTSKEKYFTKKLVKELDFLIKTIQEQEKDCSLEKHLLEHKIEIDESRDGWDIKFKGFIDKIIYDEYQDQTVISLIDYKTGNVSGSIDQVIYGLEMQLPTYLYLIKYSNIFSNIRYAGFYLQQVLNGETKIDPGKSLLSQKKEKLKLKGYSNSDEEILSLFDSYYQESRIIKSMKKTNKGFSIYAKLLNDEKINNLIELTKKNIMDASFKIINADFSINPKKIGKENEGCKYCKYQDICFKKEEDIIYLEEKKELDYL